MRPIFAVIVLALVVAGQSASAQSWAQGNRVIAPGGSSGTYPGRTILRGYPTAPYYWGAQPGFYNANPYAPAFPAYGGLYGQTEMVLPAPYPVAGGLFGVKGNGFQFNFWKSPSGYYYPWCAQPFVQPTTVIYMQEGSQEPAQPPLSTMFADMKKYLEESKQKGTLTDANYNHLMLRLSDLTKMDEAARSHGDGVLDPRDESDVRAKVTDLGLEISRSVKN